MALEFAGPATRLTQDDIIAVAGALAVDPPAVRAVCDVEAAGSGSLPDGRPTILFEAHAFWNETGGSFGESNISSPVWDRTLYGAGGAHQYDRLAQAIALDRDAALKSTSWGLFQIMGGNFLDAGFADVETMVAAMILGEPAQLAAFGAFCRVTGLATRLRAHDWAGFARGYNGPGYAANGYDSKLAGAWRKWSAGMTHANPAPRTEPPLFHATLQLSSRGAAVRALQEALCERGYALAVDGDFGPATGATLRQFQRAAGLHDDGVAGPLTFGALGL